MFQEFDERMSNLDRGFQAFENAVLQLGSSGGLISVSKVTREQLSEVRIHFRENVCKLRFHNPRLVILISASTPGSYISPQSSPPFLQRQQT